jgi:hypothetical protein
MTLNRHIILEHASNRRGGKAKIPMSGNFWNMYATFKSHITKKFAGSLAKTTLHRYAHFRDFAKTALSFAGVVVSSSQSYEYYVDGRI